MTPLPEMPALRGYVTLRGHVLTLRVPAWHWAWRGIVVGVALPPLFALLALLTNLDADAALAPLALLGGLGGVVFLVGMLLALASPLLSARSRTELDFARGLMTTARSSQPVELATLTCLRLGRIDRLSQFLSITATREAGELRVLGPLVQRQAGDAALLVQWLGATLQIPVYGADVEQGSVAGASDDRLAGVLCYLPIQGVFIIASLYYLVAGRRRPFVRFCAIQSLSQLVFSVIVLAAILLGLGAPLALVEPSSLQVVLIVALSVVLGLFWLWNFGAHAYACYSAYKGRAWVMPWLAFWVRRFLPNGG